MCFCERLNRFNDRGEDFWMFASKFGQDFTVKNDLFYLESVDEFGVGCSVQTRCGVDADLLQATVIALLEFAITVGVCAGFSSGGLCKSDFALASPHHSFCAGKDITTSLDAMGSTFYARHTILSVRHE